MQNVQFLGDPHLGRTFKNNVPLARRGERELMIERQFVDEVSKTDADIHICLGDLFDRTVVPYRHILLAAVAYNANKNPNTQYYILQGNHDAGKDTTVVTAFDVFKRVIIADNVHVITEPMVAHGILFCPWSPTYTAEEIVNQVETDEEIRFAVGHWDTNELAGPDNQVPYEALEKLGVTRAYTGHVHKATEITKGDFKLTVYGSMQPYAHGEESDDELYVTVSLTTLLEDLTLYKNKHLRVVLEPGEVLDQPVDCLQLTIKRNKDDGDLTEETVELGSFDMKKLMDQAFTEQELPEVIREELFAEYEARS